MPVNQQQLDYLQAMGIPVWISRDLEVPDAPVVTELQADVAPVSGFDAISADLANPTASAQPAVSAEPASATEPSQTSNGPIKAANDLIRDLQGAGQAKQRIADIAASLETDKAPAVPETVPIQDLSGLGLQEIQQAVESCSACNLSSHRKQTVFARGNSQAQWMIVGDIPRLADEQAQSPFEGEAGVMLTNMLKSLSLDPNAVYVTNLMKCRPPLDNSPSDLQAHSCATYLRRQIDIVKPELVILMGRDTAQLLLGSKQPMAQMRQQVHQVDGFAAPMVVTYHPAYLMKQPRLKAQTWKDLQYAKSVMS
ncbi:hypothetical protein EOL70_25565 [Leucothrix sargassi]|nr:hypothetical protein EOL70_25565 [Leucothrix sargassi]